MVTETRVIANFIDGPKLADWLEAEGLITKDFTPSYLNRSQRHAFWRWQKGQKADVGHVDRLLTELHRHIEELPDDLFLVEASKRPNEITPDLQDRIVTYRRLGWTFREIGAMVGVNRETVRRYVRKAGLA